MKNVLCVPKLAANLLSVSKITENGNRVVFDREGCSIINSRNEKIAYANLINGMYCLPIYSPKGFVAKNSGDIVT